MNIKITSKDGITLKTQGKYCTEDIKINVGDEVGGGGATITRQGGLIGTPVPNTGVVEKVYFNTALSVEEVVYLVSQLTYTERSEGVYVYTLYSNSDGSSNLIVMFDGSSLYEIYINQGTKYFDNNVGWTENATDSLTLNIENIIGSYGMSTQNNLLSSLFSTTPFTQNSEQVLLEGDYDGSTLVVDELPKGGWQGTTVPNSGYIENIYFNTALSTEEVINLINSANLPMINAFGNDSYFLGVTGDYVHAFRILKDNELYEIRMIIVHDLATFHFSEMIIFTQSNGWTKEAFGEPVDVGVFPLKIDFISEYNGVQVGTKNNKLVSLFSTTPFVETKTDTIDVKALIDQKKIPLEIKVKSGIIEVDKLPEVGKEGSLYKLNREIGLKIYLQNSSMQEMAAQLGLTLPCDLKDYSLAIMAIEGGVNGSFEYKVIEVNESNFTDITKNPELMIMDNNTMSIYLPIYYMSDEYSRSQYNGFTFMSFGESTKTENGETITYIEGAPFVHEMVAGMLGLPYETDTEMFVGKVDSTDDMTADGYYVMDGGTVEDLYLFEADTYKKVALGITKDIINATFVIEGGNPPTAPLGDMLNVILGINVSWEYYLINDLNVEMLPSTSDKIHLYIYDKDPDKNYFYYTDGENILNGSDLNLSDFYKGVVTIVPTTSGIYVTKTAKDLFYYNNECISSNGTINITEQGTYDVSKYEKAIVDMGIEELRVTPTTTQQVFDAKNYNPVYINPIPNNYIIPSGQLKITESGTHDVTKYASVSVDVGIKTSDATATIADIRLGKTAYVNDVKITGAIEDYNGSYEGEIYLPTGNMIEITDTNTTNVVGYETAKVVDSKLIPDNIKEGVNILGVIGTYRGTDSGINALQILIDTKPDCRSIFSRSNSIAFDFLNSLDTSNVTDMSFMFDGCSRLITIPPLNTSNVTDMSYMFQNCTELKTIPQLDTSNVTDIAGMFNVCKKLNIVPPLNTSNVINMSNLFMSCIVLEKVDLSFYNISFASNSNYLCHGCYSLKQIIIRGFGSNYILSTNSFTSCYHLTGTVNATYNPNGDKDGYIYVPRNMCDTLKSATNWSTYADQIRALEDYTIDGTTTGELDKSKI